MQSLRPEKSELVICKIKIQINLKLKFNHIVDILVLLASEMAIERQKRNAVMILMVFSSLFIGLVRSQSDTTIRPNIVIFIADDLGIGDIGCFGNDTIRTPNIDQIAREGAKLNHNLAAEAICTPSRAAIMTGRYPIRSGMTTGGLMRVISHAADPSGLPENEITIGKAARQAGYHTALIGKWHLGVHGGLFNLYSHHPLGQGFDYYYGTPVSNVRDFDPNATSLFTKATPTLTLSFKYMAICGFVVVAFLLKRGTIGYLMAAVIFMPLVAWPLYLYVSYTHIRFFNSMIMRNEVVVEQPINLQHITSNLVNQGVRYIEQRKESGEPFLLVMSWLQVHTALHASERFRNTTKHGRYGAEVEEMDWSVGEIMSALRRNGYMDNTLVYFTSDNGGHMEEGANGETEGGWNGIYRGSKGQGGMEGGIRMPTVMMWQNYIAPDTVINHPTSHMDLLPTLMALWGQSTPTDRIIDGTNIYPLLSGRDTTPPHRFLMHYCGTDIHSARYTPDETGDVYKIYYIVHKDYLPGTFTCAFMCFCTADHVTVLDTPELYNIGRDPAEKHPLDIRDPHHAQIVSLLNEAVKVHRDSVEHVPSQLALWRQMPMPWLQPCCNFPFCSCSDTTFTSR